MTNKLVNYLKNLRHDPITIIFFLAVLASFIYHLDLRTQHFQECDSSGTYHLMYGFPKEALLYSAYSYPDSRLLSEDTARKLLNLKPAQYFAQTYLPDFTEERLVNKLTRTNIFLAMRFVYIQAVSSLHLPHALESMFALPFSATFSPGYGLIYGLVTGANYNYEQFMSRATLVTTIFFHLAVLLVYFTGRKLKASAFASAIAASLMLFAITMYGSNYDVGSRPWNLISAVVWVWCLAKYADSPKVLKKVSIASAILVYFNYLIVFFWAAFVLAESFRANRQSVKSFLKQIWQVLKTQKIAIVFIFLCGLIFFQPGQGFRGNISLGTMFSDIYYIVLNFFSFYTHSHWLNIGQFILGLLLIVLSIRAYFKLSKNQDDSVKIVSLTLLFIFVLYALAALVKAVGLAPNRQMVFLVAAIYPGIALALDNLLLKSKFLNFNKILTCVLVLFLALGFSGLILRRVDALDRTAGIVFAQDVERVEVQDCSFNLVNKTWDTQTPVEFVDLTKFKSGQTLLFLSQTTSFEKALKMWRESYNLEVEIVSQKQDINLTYFVAYNPDFARFPFSRPNSLYEVKFKVIEVSKK